jgi:hypothetical protein
MTTRSETPDTVHGRLLESVHVSGYTFERACSELEWLLDKDRWKRVGGGYEDINAFMASIEASFSEFRPVAEKRRKIAKRLAELNASQRQTARLLGANETTIRRDLGKRAAKAAEPPADVEKSAGIVMAPSGAAAHAAAMREANRESARDQREADRDARRSASVRAAAAATIDAGDFHVKHGPFLEVAREVADGSLRLIFTDPPYHDKTIGLYRDLGRVAARVLRDGGSLITYTSHHRLPDVIALVQAAGLAFFWPLAMVHTGQKARMTEYGIVVNWKPLLWFVKGTFRDRTEMAFLDDLVMSERQKSEHDWQQSTVEAEYYIQQLTHPGDLVFDPFCGGGTTAVAAQRTSRRWLTCDVDESCVLLARRRVMEAINGSSR